MVSKEKVDENDTPNIEHEKEKSIAKVTLSWSSILSSGDSVSGGGCKKRRKKSVSRCKASLDQYLNQGVSPSQQSSFSSLKINRESQIRKKKEWSQGFQLNRIFFEEFPIYQKKVGNPGGTGSESESANPPELCTDRIRGSVKLLPRNIGLEALEGPPLPFFQSKKVCLLEGEEYLFHSRRQLLLKLRWYGARTQDYYSSRADYVICSSTFNEVMSKLSQLSPYGEHSFDAFRMAGNDNFLESHQNLRGVRIGQQVKLTELEFLEFVGEDLGTAVNLMRISELETPEKEEHSGRFKLLRPRTVWELVGNKDSADELYSSLLNLRLQSEDSDLLKSQGIEERSCGIEDSLSTFGEEICGLFVLISPGNVGSQICAELAALGSGYEVKVYKGSEVVEPIVKQWKKGHFFKLFDAVSPPICTIMTDCSGVIKTGDILKIKNSYYNSIFLRDEVLLGGAGFKGVCIPGSSNRQNPGAIVLILEETSEPAQFLLAHCNNSTRPFGCSRSYSLHKLDGGGGSSGVQAIKVFRFNSLTKSGVACKLFSRFRNPALLNILISQFGPNIIKTSQIMHWIHLLDSEDLGGKLSCISLSYTPILFDSALEVPLLMIQKCFLNQEESSIREEIWSFSSLGSAEGQTETFRILLKVLYDVITAVMACFEDKEATTLGLQQQVREKPNINYASGFGIPEHEPEGHSQTSIEAYSKFLHGLAEADSLYQLRALPHLTFHTLGPSLGSGSSLPQQQEKAATCESYFETLYSISLFNLTAVLRESPFHKKLFSEKVINLVNEKLLKYSPVNSSYDKTTTNYYLNKRQEISLSWRSAEYLMLKQAGSTISQATWKTISTDSAILQLYFRKKLDSSKFHDIVSYVPSKVPKLNVRIPELLKQGFLAD
ncbi:BRCT domain containing protein [Cryptosporidium felis]|nr:BRCT domain containing protein [Cryptosporidium felis]